MAELALSSLFVVSLALGPAAVERWRPPELAVKRPPPAKSFEEVRDIAFGYLGRPYVMGGVGSPGFDCSGFVCRVFAEAGYALPRVSRDQARAGKRVPFDRLLPGDLLFFVHKPGDKRIAHVGMYLGNGELVHAGSGDGKVEVASLKARWFATRIVEARRVLPDPNEPERPSSSTSTAAVPLAETYELVEHSGDDVLVPMLRLPPAHPVPSYGPQLQGAQETSVGVRSALVTENGELGFVLAPEAKLRINDIALVTEVAVPIRFPFGGHATLGPLDRPADYARFLRTLSLGLRGADLELRLSRLGDETLLDGLLLERVAPGSVASGVPGLSILRSPLSFFGALRSGIGRAELFADDVIDPALFGGAIEIPLVPSVVDVGVAFASDQKAQVGVDPRAIDAAEGRAQIRVVETPSWTLSPGVSVGAIRALGLNGFGVEGDLVGEYRFSRGASRLRATVRGGRLGEHFVDRLFGPTYLAFRARHSEALEAAGPRSELSGELLLQAGHLTLGASFADGVGVRRQPFDRQAGLLFDVAAIPIGGTRLIDLRLAVLSRAIFSSATAVTVVHGGVRLRFTSWFFGELYLEQASVLQGGGGLTITFTL
jgi:NlpC/P60 family protein